MNKSNSPFMRGRRAISVFVWWALAQPAPAPLASLFPAGALLYLEAKDAGALLQDWDSSTEKTSWLQSSNYGSFTRSHLFLRLADAQTEFAQAAGVPADYALYNSVAGGNSAVAMYDIGKLEFLYITHLPSARALNTRSLEIARLVSNPPCRRRRLLPQGRSCFASQPRPSPMRVISCCWAPVPMRSPEHWS